MATEADLPGEALDPAQDSHCGVSISGHVLWQPEGPPEPLEPPPAVLFQQRRAGRLDPTHPTAHRCCPACYRLLTPPLTLQMLPHQWDWGLAQGCGCLQLQDWLPWPCCSLGPYSQVQLRCLAQGHQGEKGGEVPPLKPEQLHSRELKEQNVNQE